jgi:hypothetical protein
MKLSVLALNAVYHYDLKMYNRPAFIRGPVISKSQHLLYIQLSKMIPHVPIEQNYKITPGKEFSTPGTMRHLEFDVSNRNPISTLLTTRSNWRLY